MTDLLDPDAYAARVAAIRRSILADDETGLAPLAAAYVRLAITALAQAEDLLRLAVLNQDRELERTVES